MTELLGNYLGHSADMVDNQKQYNGPIIVTSNNYYSWGDLLTFRYVGIVKNSESHLNQYFQQLISSKIPSSPIHLRYHTISVENPIMLIHEFDNNQPIIINLSIQNYLETNRSGSGSRFIKITNESDFSTMSIFINNDSDDKWIPSSTNSFVLSTEPLLMIVITSKIIPNSFILILEASESYDQNLPQPSELALETYVANLVDEAIEEAVQEVLQQE